MIQLQLLHDLAIGELVLQARLYQVDHSLLHVRGEGVVVDLLIEEELALFELLLVGKLLEWLLPLHFVLKF